MCIRDSSNTEDKLCIQSRSFNRWDMGFISTYGDKPKTAGSAYLKNLNIMQLGKMCIRDRYTDGHMAGGAK